MEKKITELKSVGCGIDENGLVYPQLKNGEYDISNMTHILDIDNKEWFEKLSQKDKDIVDDYIKTKTLFWGEGLIVNDKKG